MIGRRGFIKKAGTGIIAGTVAAGASDPVAAGDEWWRENWQESNDWEAFEKPASEWGHTLAGEHVYVERRNRDVITHPTYGDVIKNNFNVVVYARVSDAYTPDQHGDDNASGNALGSYGLEVSAPGNFTHINYPKPESGNVIGGRGPTTDTLLSETGLDEWDLSKVNNEQTVQQELEDQAVGSGVASALVSAGSAAATYFGMSATGYGLAFLGFATAFSGSQAGRDAGEYWWDKWTTPNRNTYEESVAHCYVWDLAVYGELTDDYIQPNHSITVSGSHVVDSIFDHDMNRNSLSIEVPLV